MIPSQVDDTLQNPFFEDVYRGDLDAEATHANLYAPELNELRALAVRLERRSSKLAPALGLTVLLTSPQAGSGKSHFLARTIADLRGVAHGCRLDFETNDPLRWDTWFLALLRAFHQAPDTRSDLTALAGQVCYLFAGATSRLISEGEVPCDSPATAGRWLDENSRRLFESTVMENESVAWFRREFEALLPPITEHYASKLAVAPDEMRGWLEWLHQYAAAGSASHLVSERRERQSAVLETCPFFSGSGEESAKRAVQVFGRLMTREAPLFFMLDGLDWLYRDESGALRLARMLFEWRRLVPSSVVILSVNEDLWRETFVAGLPEAIRDRLTTQVITLQGVPASDWEAFLMERSRADHSDQHARVRQIAAKLRAEVGSFSFMTPRRLIRLAARHWSSTTDAIAPLPDEERTRTVIERNRRESRGKAVPNGDSTSKAFEPEAAWRHALGDVQQLIQGRADQPRLGNGHRLRPPIWSRAYPAEKADTAKPDITPDLGPDTDTSDTSHDLGESKSPAETKASPALSHEFKSFLARLRSRAEPKEDYLPTTQGDLPGDPADERALIRNSLILHGKKPEIPTDEKNPPSEIAPTQTDETPAWVAERLQALAAEIDQSDALRSVDPEKLRKIVELAGRLFPAVAQETFVLEDHPGEPVLRWRFHQSEVHLGFAGAKDRRFWPALLEYTATRARDLREQEKTRLKLVVFAHINDTGIFESWNPGGTENAVHCQFCDAVFLTRSQLRTLYALAALLEEQENDARREEIFLQACGQLDFLWKMITRPVWTALRPNFRHD